MKNILITGATGLIGSKLIPSLLKKGYNISILSRSAKSISNVKTYVWDIDQNILPQEAIDNADCIIHLAGANVGTSKWTDSRKQQIIDSRTKSGELLFDRIQRSDSKLDLFITASAVGYYGLATSEKIFTEKDEAANDFFGEVGAAWESILDQTKSLQIRSVALRIGVVLAKEDGALPKMSIPLKFGFGTPIGDGKQYVPWIHIDDIVALFVKTIEEHSINGIYNASAPEHVTNHQFMKSLCHVRKRLFIPIGIPAFLLRLALGEMANIVLKGSRVSTDKILNSGFVFQFPTLEKALDNLV